MVLYGMVSLVYVLLVQSTIMAFADLHVKLIVTGQVAVVHVVKAIMNRALVCALLFLTVIMAKDGITTNISV